MVEVQSADSVLPQYLDDARAAALTTIRSFLPTDTAQGSLLYDLILDYPMRQAKGLRPALCIATCRAFGGLLDHALPSAAVIELFHNAFLIHDDIEDGSELRRGAPTLHLQHGVPVAINVGDAMLCLTLEPLLKNMSIIGLGPSLRILQLIARMTRETVEGQALELDWIAKNRWEIADDDYIRMVEKKTGWYSFVAPVTAGAIAARVSAEVIDQLGAIAIDLGTAFQIQDDLLNLEGNTDDVGKEPCGDIWEGKRTLVLLHALRAADAGDRARATALLERPRHARDGAGPVKTEDEVAWLRDLMDRTGALERARGIAHRTARRARDELAGVTSSLADSVHRQFLEGVVDFVLSRTS